MVGRYLGAPNCLTNCEVSSARGELRFEPVCHVELVWGCLLARLLVNSLDLRNTLYSSKLLTLFSFHLTSRSLDFLCRRKLCALVGWYLVATVLALGFDLRVHVRGVGL